MARRQIAVELVVTGAQQARQVLNNFSRDLSILTAQGEAQNKAFRAFQDRTLPATGPAGSGLGFQLKEARQQLDAVGNTIKVVSQGMLTFGDGQELLGVRTKSYTGDLRELLAAQKAYGTALEDNDQKMAVAATRVGALSTKYQGLLSTQQDIIGKSQGHIAFAQNILNTPNTRIPQLQADVTRAGMIAGYGRQQFAAGTITQTELDIKNAAYAAAIDALKAEIKRDTARRTRASNLLNAANTNLTAATSEAARLIAREARGKQLLAGPLNRQRAGIVSAGEAAIMAAYNKVSPLPPGLASVGQESPALIRKLQQIGLGVSPTTRQGAAFGSEQFTRNLIDQGAYESINVQKDLVRQVTRVSGSFTDQQGVLKSFSAEYDKSGKVITRFGSNLSGLGNVLNQLGRDFQKVIEFAIATTVVFGSFQYAIKQIDTIKELDKSIRQLSITANLTRPDALKLFEDVADIAISTATPLKELVKATDDIALATKRAGQSTSEWREDILSLTQSVGILTNLAGIDTVAATDQLVSTMKQLGVEANELPGILNKVTAVAGGQSNAIADVIKGLGVMAEAGKQAGLSIDQMIATIQTLSQVTSKSPAEVATSLKNLVGSIDGPAGTKALKKYNIELRDSAGNLRNIIDIYSEISDKINRGLIPQADVKGLVRAIAGGPRRAPDAAALLSSIEDINEVSAKSINATNEALLANAKILDTVNAKFTQLQAAIDKFATTKFADVLNQAAGSLADTLTALLEILESIPTGVYLGIIQFGLMAASMKFAISVGTFLLGTLRTMGAGFLALAGNIGVATAAQKAFNATGQQGPVAPSRAGRIGAGLRGAAPILAAGALGAGVSAATGGDLSGVIGTGLQTAGILALTVPEPAISKALGVALIGAGFAVQLFGGQTKEANKQIDASSESMLNAIQAYRDASEVVSNLGKSQDELGGNIEKLLGVQTKSKDENEQLLAFQNEYAANAAKLVGANQALIESFSKLNSTLADSDFKEIQIQAARAGVYTEEQLRKLTQDIAPQILQATNPNFVAPDDFTLPSPQLGTFAATSGSTIAQFTGREGIKPIEIRFDLTKLESDANAVKDLFSDSGEELTATFAPTYENLQLIDSALRDIKDSTDPGYYKNLQQAFQGYASSVNALFAAERNVAIYSAYLEAGGATGLFTPEQVNNGRSILSIYQTLIGLIPRGTADIPIGPPDETRGVDRAAAQKALLDQATSFAFDEKGRPRTDITKESAIEMGTEILKAAGSFDDLESKGTVLRTIAEMFKNAGVEVAGLTDNMQILGAAASESLLEFQTSLGELNQSTLTTTTQKLAELQAQFQGGEFKDNEGAYKQQVNQLLALQSTVAKVTEQYIKLTDTLPNFDIRIQELGASLATVNGLQDAQYLSAGQLIGRLFELADTYGLTGSQVKLLGDRLIELGAKLAALPDYKKIIFDIQTVITTTAARSPLTLGTGDYGKELQTQINQATRDQSKATSNIFKDFTSYVNNLFKSGKGTALDSKAKSAAAKKAQGPDVSTLDLPEEIANAANRSALIQEAIRRATALQRQIPGATKEASNDIVELLKGTQRILEVRGVKDDLLRKALEELAEIEKKRLEFETKADTIRRIRVGAGDFTALANVPVNTRTGVSLGGPQGPVNVTLNLNGTILTPAQLSQFADLIAASLKRQIANG